MGDLYERSHREVVATEGCSKCGSIAGQPCVSKKGEPMNTYAHSARYQAAQQTELNNQPATERAVPEIQTLPPGLQAVAEQNLKDRAHRIKVVRDVLQIMTRLDGPGKTLDNVARLLVDYDVDDMILSDDSIV